MEQAAIVRLPPFFGTPISQNNLEICISAEEACIRVVGFRFVLKALKSLQKKLQKISVKYKL
jgi:hypothetical protein